MSYSYSDNVFHSKRRKWFGLMLKHGGDSANSTGGFAQSSGADTNFVERWYPEGAIDIHKVGYFLQTALGGASRTRLEFQFKTNNANDSIAIVRPTTTTVAVYTIASSTSLTTAYCTRGSYISIIGATPHVAAQSTLSYNAVTGTMAFFIDYTPRVGNHGWDVNP